MKADEVVERIYAAERGAIYSYLLYLGLPAARAQDLAQDAFLTLYQAMLDGKTVENPRAWLYRVAHNLAVRTHTRELQFDELGAEVDPPDEQPDPERALMEKRRLRALRAAVRTLSGRQRNCLYLRAQGLRHREIADTIGISTSAVSEFLRRAAARLKEALHE
jgi:RNA polymerase sigma-70 factor (ECF subfamily)